MNENYLQELSSKLELSHILVDTTGLIDSLRHPEIFSPIFRALKDRAGVTLVTIDSVAIEFYKGSRSPQDYEAKRAVFDQIVDATLPTTQEVNGNALELAGIYGSRGKDASSTDYLLGGVLKKYTNSKIFLMTRDHGDFPATIFDRVAYLPVGYEYEVHTYGFYKFDPTKFEKQARAFLKGT